MGSGQARDSYRNSHIVWLSGSKRILCYTDANGRAAEGATHRALVRATFGM